MLIPHRLHWSAESTLLRRIAGFRREQLAERRRKQLRESQRRLRAARAAESMPAQPSLL